MVRSTLGLAMAARRPFEPRPSPHNRRARVRPLAGVGAFTQG